MGYFNGIVHSSAALFDAFHGSFNHVALQIKIGLSVSDDKLNALNKYWQVSTHNLSRVLLIRVVEGIRKFPFSWVDEPKRGSLPVSLEGNIELSRLFGGLQNDNSDVGEVLNCLCHSSQRLKRRNNLKDAVGGKSLR